MIHSFGSYSSGIKIDTIPGRINVAATLRALIKGEHRGFRFESRGQGHSSTLLLGLTIGISSNSIIFGILIIPLLQGGIKIERFPS